MYLRPLCTLAIWHRATLTKMVQGSSDMHQRNQVGLLPFAAPEAIRAVTCSPGHSRDSSPGMVRGSDRFRKKWAGPIQPRKIGIVTPGTAVIYNRAALKPGFTALIVKHYSVRCHAPVWGVIVYDSSAKQVGRDTSADRPLYRTLNGDTCPRPRNTTR